MESQKAEKKCTKMAGAHPINSFQKMNGKGNGFNVYRNR